MSSKLIHSQYIFSENTTHLCIYLFSSCKLLADLWTELSIDAIYVTWMILERTLPAAMNLKSACLPWGQCFQGRCGSLSCINETSVALLAAVALTLQPFSEIGMAGTFLYFNYWIWQVLWIQNPQWQQRAGCAPQQMLSFVKIDLSNFQLVKKAYWLALDSRSNCSSDSAQNYGNNVTRKTVKLKMQFKVQLKSKTFDGSNTIRILTFLLCFTWLTT